MLDSIAVLGLNPALQRTLVISGALNIGGVHRASTVDIRAGGKGQGVAAAIARLQPETSPLIVQLLGRDPTRAGERVEEALRASGVEQLTGWYDGETRTCTSIVSEPGFTTEFIEPSASVPKAFVSDLLERTLRVLSARAAVVIAGTAPPGAEDFYARLLDAMIAAEQPPKAARPLVVLDGYKAVAPLLATGRVDVLKVNRDELLELAGVPAMDEAAQRLLRDAGSAPPGEPDVGGLGQRRRKALSQSGAAAAPDGSDGGILAVTDGASPAHLYTMTADGRLKKWQLAVPHVPVINAVGAGDVCTGVFSYRLSLTGFGGAATGAAGATGLCDAFAFGLAAASARCARLRPDELEVSDVFRLRTHVVIREVTAVLAAAPSPTAPASLEPAASAALAQPAPTVLATPVVAQAEDATTLASARVSSDATITLVPAEGADGAQAQGADAP